MKITIAGDLGSGKSSVAKYLCKELGYRYISTGQLHRQMAEKYGVNALELNHIAKEDALIDNAIDGYLRSLNDEPGDFVIDSRLAWHFVQNTFKIYLEVNSEIGADRIYNDDKRSNEPVYDNKITALNKIKERKDAEHDRFYIKYNIKCHDKSNYDVVINTSVASIKVIAELIKQLIALAEENLTFPKYWVSPKFIYNTQDIQSLNSDEARKIKLEMSQNGYNYGFPLECVIWDELYFLWNGHKRLSAALFNNIEYVPVEVIADNMQEIIPGLSIEQFVQDSFNKNKCHNWEDIHNFRYSTYPVFTNSHQ